jgi:alpha-D-xyloside xylohydrolase
VIDFFNQKVNGDFEMNPACYPDPQALVTAVKEHTGANVMVSIWPNIEPTSRCVL